MMVISCLRSNVLLRELELCREPVKDTWEPCLWRSSGVNERDSGVSERCLRILLDELYDSLRSGVRERCRWLRNGDPAPRLMSAVKVLPLPLFKWPPSLPDIAGWLYCCWLFEFKNSLESASSFSMSNSSLDKSIFTLNNRNCIQFKINPFLLCDSQIFNKRLYI